MWETIVAALISACAAIVVSVIQSNANHKKSSIQSNENYKKLSTELEKRDELQQYRIEQLEKKVDKHNNVIERTYELEKTTAVLQNDIKVANHRIDDLEKK